MPNIGNIKKQDGGNVSKTRGASQGSGINNKGTGILLLNTDSMDRETANTSKLGNNHTAGGSTNHKRMASNPNGNSSYVKVQNSEIMSSATGTADGMFQGGLPSTNNYTTAGQNSRGGPPP